MKYTRINFWRGTSFILPNLSVYLHSSSLCKNQFMSSWPTKEKPSPVDATAHYYINFYWPCFISLMIKSWIDFYYNEKKNPLKMNLTFIERTSNKNFFIIHTNHIIYKKSNSVKKTIRLWLCNINVLKSVIITLMFFYQNVFYLKGSMYN